MMAYLIHGHHLAADDAGFAEALAAAHASHHRPLCLCLVQGTEMYVARLAGTNEGFIVKRMPYTGSHHAPDCPSYEPPAELSGLGQVLGSAISENPATGETTLRLGFTMSRNGGRSTLPTAASANERVATDGTKLTLRGLLHYLWDQAELTRWQPGFAGKRSWATVRKHLLLAAENKIARGSALKSRLYIPEVFAIEQRDAINARRVAQWAHARASPGKPHHLMLLIAEVKEIVPARYGYKAVIKHVPDQALALDEQLYRRLGRCFEAELSMWGAANNLHMVMIATFGVSEAGVPTIAELSLMPVTTQWIPVENAFEVQLVERLVSEGRRFAKCMRYNLAAEGELASAVLLDTENPPCALRLTRSTAEESTADVTHTDPMRSWTWCTSQSAMPALPAASNTEKGIKDSVRHDTERQDAKATGTLTQREIASVMTPQFRI